MPPRLSIVIPVWNDSAALGACLNRLRDRDAPPSEIIVCDASSEPAELARVRALTRAHGATLLSFLRPGRGAQLAAGAGAATGDVIVFSHADTSLTGAHLYALLERLDTAPSLQAGAFHRDVASLYPHFAWATPLIQWWMAGLGPIYGDQSPFILRASLQSLGGYPSLPLMEDLAFSDFLRHQLPRDEVALLLPPLPTSPRRFQRQGRLRTKLQNLVFTAAWRLGLASPEHLHQLYYRRQSTSSKSTATPDPSTHQ